MTDNHPEAAMGAIIPNIWAEGLNPTYQRMSHKQTELYLMATMLEIKDKNFKMPETGGDELLLMNILKKRIERMKLPISFTDTAFFGMMGLIDSPGSAVVLLVDCLNAYEGKTVNLGLLSNLYSTGFYDEPTLIRYVDDFMKTRKVKWSQIY